MFTAKASPSLLLMGCHGRFWLVCLSSPHFRFIVYRLSRALCSFCLIKSSFPLKYLHPGPNFHHTTDNQPVVTCVTVLIGVLWQVSTQFTKISIYQGEHIMCADQFQSIQHKEMPLKVYVLSTFCMDILLPLVTWWQQILFYIFLYQHSRVLKTLSFTSISRFTTEKPQWVTCSPQNRDHSSILFCCTCLPKKNQ